MSKWVRRLVVLLVLLVLVVGIFLIPAVQKALFLAFVSTDERPVAVDYLRVWPGSLEVRGLEFSDGSILARIPSIEADFSTAAILRGRVSVGRLVAEEIFIKIQESEESGEDVEDTDSSSESPALKIFEGILGRPIPVQVGEISIAGLVAGPDEMELDFSIEAADILPGNTARVEIVFQPLPTSPGTVPAASFSIPITIDSAGNLSGMSFEGVVSSRMPEAVGDLLLKGSVEPTDSGESYELGITSDQLLPGGQIALSGAFERAERIVFLTLTAKGDSLDFLQPIATEQLPAVAFQVEGKTEWNPAEGFRAIDLSFQLDGEAGILPGFEDPIRAVGSLMVSAGNESITVSEMRLSVAPPNDARPWVGLELLEPQTIALGDSLSIPESRFASLEVFLPEAFLNSFETEWKFSDFNAKADLAGVEEGIVLNAEQPWSVSIAREDAGGLVDLQFKPTISYKKDELDVSGEMEISEATSRMAVNFTAKAEGERFSEISFDLSADGDMSPIATLAPETLALSAGTIATSWKGKFDGSLELDGTFKGEGIVIGPNNPVDLEWSLADFQFSPEGSRSVKSSMNLKWLVGGSQSSVMDLQFAAVEEADGRWSLSVPQGRIDFDSESLEKWSAGGSAPATVEKSEDKAFPFDPSDLDWLRDPASIPFNIETLEIEGKLRHLGEIRDFNVSLSNLFPSKEGQFVVEMESPAGRSTTLAGSINGDIRLDENAAPSRIKALANIKNVSLGEVSTGLTVDITVAPKLPVDPVSVRISAVEGGVNLLFLRSNLAKDVIKATIEADFANWLKSPLRHLFPNLSTGLLQGELKIGAQGLDSRLSIKGLTPLDAFESYDLELDGQVAALNPMKGGGSLKLTDAKGKTSDVQLTVAGNAERAVTLTVAGDRVDMEALEGFGSVWSSGADDPVEVAPREEDGGLVGEWPLGSLPFEVSGSVAIGEVLPVGLPSFRSLDGVFRADTEKASLRVAAGWLESSSLALEGRIARTADDVEGSVDAKVRDLPLGPLLRKLNPGETPSIEGVGTFGMVFDGRAPSLGSLPSWMVGNLDFSVKNGVLRALRPEARITRLVSAGSVIGMVVGSELNRPGVVALGEVTNLFKAVPFESLDLSLQRTKDRETLIESLVLRGSYFSMNGSGRIETADLDEIASVPVKLDLQLGSKPPLTSPLETLALLGAETDRAGYRIWKQPIQITGTLREPNADDFWAIITGAVERAATMSSKDLAREREASGTESTEKKKKPSKDEKIEQGVNSLIQALGL